MIKSFLTVLSIVSVSILYSNDNFLDSFKEFTIPVLLVKAPCENISLNNGKTLPSLYMENLLYYYNPLFHDSFKFKNSLVTRYTGVCKFYYGDFWYVLVRSSLINSYIKHEKYILIQCDSNFKYIDSYDLHEGFEKSFKFKVSIVKNNIVLKISDRLFKFNKSGECVYGLNLRNR